MQVSGDTQPKSKPKRKLFEKTHEMIIRMYLDLNQPQPTDAVRETLALSWAEHFQKNGVIWPQIDIIYDAALKTRSEAIRNKSFIQSPVFTISDLLAEWNQLLEDGYWVKNVHESEEQKVAALPAPEFDPNQKGYRIFKMNQQRWQAGKDAVCCDCVDAHGCGVVAGLTNEETYFCCELRQCNFREKVENLMTIRVHPSWQIVNGGLMSDDVIPHPTKTNAPETPPAAKAEVLMTDEELLENLESRCNFLTEKIGTEKSLAFGKLLLKKEPILLRWNVDLARANWKEFIAEAA